MSKPLLTLLAAAALVAVLVIGLSQSKDNNTTPDAFKLTPQQVAQRLAGAPPQLAALHRQSSQLLGGGRKAFEARIASLEGVPVVVNKWGSWCGPCRLEFPLFQNTSVAFGKTVAFVGLNAGDNHGDATSFLKNFPVSYPSYEDPNDRVSLDLGWGSNAPVTVFFNAKGKQIYLHQGLYTSQAKLAADIRRYAINS